MQTTDIALPPGQWTPVATTVTYALIQLRSGVPVSIYIGNTAPPLEATGVTLKNLYDAATFGEGLRPDDTIYVRPQHDTTATVSMIWG